MVDVNNPIPLHLQLKDVIAREIKNEVYKEKIPSERDLMDRFSISRTTVREAISHLVQEGILEKVHGKGTFISQKPPVHEWLDSLHSLTDTVTKMGMKPGSKLLAKGMVTEPSYIADLLQVDLFYSIERLRTADSIPIAIERHFYNEELGQKLANYDLETTTIYDTLENSLGIEMEEAEQFISCKEVSEQDAHHLDIPVGSSVLCVERLITDANGTPIEYYMSNFRPDMYVFRIQTKRKK
ncbi:GntR family transcriptional regulator [Cytobacillus eiseniae]|uniref:GntR family transcriptional regulator n=1 Tax=Cytobacillus eiseniae TaxID=762947 RepID=A0ABS4RJ52_9BACI|nr:GntR family transcriptional regulator [Cytobacillus eiseniae]MBP2242922.1 GntR family transcriptional regulator [Cytobacillus eiseniae]